MNSKDLLPIKWTMDLENSLAKKGVKTDQQQYYRKVFPRDIDARDRNLQNCVQLIRGKRNFSARTFSQTE